jgi:hypothetical protein
MAFQPIENYGVIGNMQSIALVGMNGSIDFLSYPEFGRGFRMCASASSICQKRTFC